MVVGRPRGGLPKFVHRQPLKGRPLRHGSVGVGTGKPTDLLQQALDPSLGCDLALSVKRRNSLKPLLGSALAGIAGFAGVVAGVFALVPAAAISWAAFLVPFPALGLGWFMAGIFFRYQENRAFRFEDRRLSGEYYPLVRDFLQLHQGVRWAHGVRHDLHVGRRQYPESLVGQFLQTLNQAEAELTMRYGMLMEASMGRVVPGSRHFSGDINILVNLKLARLGSGKSWYPNQWDAA